MTQTRSIHRPLPDERSFCRRNALRLMAAGAVGAVVDAAVIEPAWLSVRRVEMRMPHWSDALDGVKIALAADMHYRGAESDDSLIDSLVGGINGEAVDLVVLPGDFIDSSPRMVARLAERLSRIQAGFGVFASLGNHDGWNADAESMRREFERNGISLLVNRHSLVEVRGQTIAICGLDSVWSGKPQPAQALHGLHAATPVVTLAHEPDFFDIVRQFRPGMLQVSGHTHGGQCRVPVAGIAPVLPRFGRKYVKGEFQHETSRLFVTSGVGTTGLRLRFACRPELVIMTLRTAETFQEN
ncbi:MAG: metallophosphoesterase [Verrucomicrobiota bacterium]